MTSMSAHQLWETALGQLQLRVSRPTYMTWLKNTRGLSLQGDRLTVGAPTPFVAEWLEKRLYQLIEETAQAIAKRPISVGFQVSAAAGLAQPQAVPMDSRELSDPRPRVRASGPHRLNEKYTFDTFVVGSGNQLAHAAARAVAEQPGERYNPLFIYSSTGLGKTHLLHAIANEATHNDLACMYVTSEQFTNEFIGSIRERKTEEFRTKYRGTDVLVVDDIQFLSGKEQTQEGFFHTFNELYSTGRQVVVASDRPPHALALLEERLRSRFQGGLMADIQPPDLETRMAIVQKKASEMAVQLSVQLALFIAQRAPSSVRELESSLTRVVALSQLTGKALTLDLAKVSLADGGPTPSQEPPSAQRVLQAVAGHFQTSEAELTGKGRAKKIVLARQVAMYLLREHQESFPEIGRLLGNRDHTTAMYAWKKLSRLLATNAELREHISRIRDLLRQL